MRVVSREVSSLEISSQTSALPTNLGTLFGRPNDLDGLKFASVIDSPIK